MKYLHYELYAGTENTIIVTLDKQANVRLMDYVNFNNYKQGLKYQFYGGLATVSPYRLKPPYLTQWHLVIDLQGFAGNVNATVQLL